MEENYEDMSNDQLRLKLLEYGFSNMPVTSTTRKVLIKKLKNHVSDGKAKVRRETIHVTKYSSDEDTEPAAHPAATKKTLTKKEPSNRRATLGGALTKPKLVKPMPEPESSSQKSDSESLKRRSGRVTPIKGRVEADVQSKVMPPYEPAILEDTDDDMIPLTQLKQRDRKSKSPSLSRADMLTTSYIHQVEIRKEPPVEPIVEEMEIDLPEQGVGVQQMESIVIDDSDDVELVSMPPPQQPSQLKPMMNEMFSIKPVNTRRTVGAPERKVNQELPKERLMANYATRAEPISTPGKTPSRNSMTTTVRSDTGPLYTSSDSPFLSEFTKRLSRLRAEAIQQPSDIGGRESASRPANMLNKKEYVETSATRRPVFISKDDYESSTSHLRPSHRFKYGSSSSQVTISRSTTGDFRASMRQTLLSLDEKYSIRKKFYCTVVFLVVVFLYVFFFM